MPKHIVLCSDGTGNTPAKGRGTNVWKTYMAVDRHDHEESSELQLQPQVAFYDDGVGTGGVRVLRLLGGAFGLGLSRNIRELYASLVLHYEPGDKVFLFGFSRGAFTIRSLAGMVCRCGLLTRQDYLNAGVQERQRLLKQILHAYRSEDKDAGMKIRKKLGLQQIEIEFIGVWDTVDAVGLPFDELKLIDAAARALRGVRLWGFHDGVLSSKVKLGCQALAIDDERRTFHPNVWEPRKGIEQVWFAGVHSNVGGGYPKEELANVSLYWMMRQAQQSGLRFVPDAVEDAHNQGNGHGKLYDSRAGLAVYYRYTPRDMAALCGNGHAHVHVTAMDRIRWATDGYAPTNLPDTFTVVDPDGVDKPWVGERVAEHQAYMEASRDERRKLRAAAAALTRRRVRLYYALIASTLLLALTLLPSLWNLETLQQGVTAVSMALRPALGWTNPAIVWILRNVEAVVSGTIGLAIPNSLEPLIESLAATPEIAALLVFVAGALFWRQRVLVRKMRELGEAMWRDAYSPERIAR